MPLTIEEKALILDCIGGNRGYFISELLDGVLYSLEHHGEPYDKKLLELVGRLKAAGY